MDEGGKPRSVFEILDTNLAGATPDLLGLWVTAPGSSAEAVTLAAPSAVVASAPLWRANLRPDFGLASVDLARAGACVGGAEEALTAAADRLQTFAEAQASGVAFQVFPPGQAEFELMLLLQDTMEGGPYATFGLGQDIAEGWAQAAQHFRNWIGEFLQVTAHSAWIETQIEGRVLGRTAVSWTGGAETVWRAGIDPAQRALHQQTWALVLASRTTLIRTAAVAAWGAARLSVLLATPGGSLLALPAAWQFITRVQAELTEHRQRAQDTARRASELTS